MSEIEAAIANALERHNLRNLKPLSTNGNTRDVYLADLVSPRGDTVGQRVVKIEKKPSSASVTSLVNGPMAALMKEKFKVCSD